jgi:diguanylate cyclase (GGDEF)-like protein
MFDASQQTHRQTTKESTLLKGLFATYHQKQSKNEMYRANILTGTCLSISIGLSVFLLYISFFSVLDDHVKDIIISIAFPVMVAFYIIIFVYKFTHAHNLCANAVVFTSIFAIAYTLVNSGGPLVSSSVFFIVVPTLLAFCLMGLRWGLFWAVATMGMHGTLIAMSFMAYPFVNPLSAHDLMLGKAIDSTFSFLIITSIIIIYEVINKKIQADLDAERERFEYLALHDNLTGLPNRKYFHESIVASMYRATRHETNTAMLLIDLNGFKPINDNYGHDAGDALLCHVANNIAQVIRQNDLASRLGGDEFAVILEDVKIVDIDIITKKILEAIALTMDYKDNKLQVTGSIGISLFPSKASTKDELIKQADDAMYYAKINQLGSFVHQA